jgi:DNA invertase Pin-like site-specific DNA recombinase
MDDDKMMAADLFTTLMANRAADDETLLPANVNYVVYARKSTVGEGRQEKSIDDQIADCFDRVIKPEKILMNDEDVIREQGSAKEPDIRPKFKKMIEDIKRGKYSGIISWHPDRLARNMKEAGEIIDLLDKRIIKDLKFATSTFENNPPGKMLLGISFVLSKQYSEHLSETVRRGNRRQTEERGRFLGQVLHGYYISDEDELYPDGNNFLIIKQAFQMRAKGIAQKDIRFFLNSQKTYTETRRHGTPKPHIWDKNSVGNMLKNPVYAGVLVYGRSIVSLVKSYGFEPVTDEQTFLEINKSRDMFSSKFQSSIRARTSKVQFLNRMIICSHCGKNMTASITTKKSGNYFRYRCDTDYCVYKGSGPRAKVIINFALNWLDDHKFTTKENYENYIKEVRLQGVTRRKELIELIRQNTREILSKQEQYDATKRAVANNGEQVAKHYNGDLDKYLKDLVRLKKLQDSLTEEKNAQSSAIMSYAKYLKLFENVANLLRSTESFSGLDKMLRKFYSNFTVSAHPVPPNNKINRWEVVDFKLNEPYKGFVESGLFQDFHSWSG